LPLDSIKKIVDDIQKQVGSEENGFKKIIVFLKDFSMFITQM